MLDWIAAIASLITAVLGVLLIRNQSRAIAEVRAENVSARELRSKIIEQGDELDSALKTTASMLATLQVLPPRPLVTDPLRRHHGQ